MVAQSKLDVANGESTEQHDLRVAMLQPSEDLRVASLTSFVRNLQVKDGNAESIAKILLNAECWLSDIVGLQNARLTKAFLREKDAAASNATVASPGAVLSKNARLKAAFGDVEDPAIDADSRASVDRVLSSLDVPNAEVIFKYGPNKDARAKYFFSSLMKMAMMRVNLETLKVFVKQLVEWNILTDEGSQLIEREIFRKACAKVVQIFLECGVEVLIEKSFKRNALTGLFGNPSVSIGFLKELEFDANARGIKDFTALHYAVQSGLVDKVRFLLDCGADPNAVNWGNETPLLLTLREPQLHSTGNKSCAELLLQHGADPFLHTWGGESFSSCVHSKNASHRYLMELALAYVRIYKSTANRSDANADLLISIESTVRRNNDLFDFYMSCEKQIRSLKKDSIHKDLTMFTVISNTGDKLLRLIDEKDRRVITEFIDKYSKGILHSYYINALQEHMRQFRKLLTCQNRAMLAISERIEKPVSSRKVLNKSDLLRMCERYPSINSIKYIKAIHQVQDDLNNIASGSEEHLYYILDNLVKCKRNLQTMRNHRGRNFYDEFNFGTILNSIEEKLEELIEQMETVTQRYECDIIKKLKKTLARHFQIVEATGMSFTDADDLWRKRFG